MKKQSQFQGRIALTAVALAVMGWVADANALGLGRLNVRSALGETLRAEIDVTSITPEEEGNLRIRVAPPESYRAAGVEYNLVLPSTKVELQRRNDGRPYLRITSDRAVQEPFVDVILEISWNTGRLVREYTLLFDPPSTRTAQAPATAPATAPTFTPAPPPSEPAPRPERRAAAPAPAPRPAPTDAPAPATRAAAPRAVAADVPNEYRVRSGDTLSRIAGRTQRPGVSLDQMLVALFQANPDAFIGENMNRLKAGVVLSVPTAEQAQSTSPSEARQIIQAQSADFGAYRQRLASGVPAVKADAASGRAGGKVQSAVEDRKQAAAPTPDKLTLSKGGVAASAPEAQVSKQLEKQDTQTRVAELSRNVEELRKLSSAASAASGTTGAAAPAPQPASAPAPAPVITMAPVAPPIASAAPPVEAPAPVTASAPAVVASAAEGVSVPADPVAASAPEEVTPAPAPAPAPAPDEQEQPGVLSSLIEDNPLALALGGGLLALLIGFGIYRFTKRGKKDSGETSFLESRLQPDSFFGASGGQRIDTRDAGGASSSMSYSLSQLDAIGDVDPVAEADVYLAYGRDLQAEEILKEAMRATPDRLAIRTKLLEVYAKRRDTKGFELLATQLYGLTNGQGDDWLKAQEIGRQIEPENPLYQPGGAPVSNAGDGGRPAAELLGASTMPQSVLPSPSEFGNSGSPSSGFDRDSGSSVDLDLDLGTESAAAPAPSFQDEVTQPIAAAPAPAALDDAVSLDLPLVDAPSTPPAPAPAPATMEFDLSSISLDLGNDSTVIKPAEAPVPNSDFGALDLDSVIPGDDADPIHRKLELAEEFRQIGDMEGARDLLQEVIAKSSGSVQARAQAMLDSLG